MPIGQRLSLRPLQITRRHVFRVLPIAEAELDRWAARARQVPDPELRRQALASIRTKRFHCQGGSVFATASSFADACSATTRLFCPISISTVPMTASWPFMLPAPVRRSPPILTLAIWPIVIGTPEAVRNDPRVIKAYLGEE